MALRYSSSKQPRGFRLPFAVYRFFFLVSIGLAVSLAAQAAPLYDGGDGATCEYFNRGAQIRWRNKLGDWTDAAGTRQGTAPFAEATVGISDTERIIKWDVTALVHAWLSGRQENSGILLASKRPRNDEIAVFHSREAPLAEQRPRLALTLTNGAVRRLPAIADTTLDCSTVSSLGSRDVLVAETARRALIQFDLSGIGGADVASASLELVSTDKQYGNTTVVVFAVAGPVAAGSETHLGLAAKYPRDRGIGKDPDVLMATGFDTALWQKDWNYLTLRGSYERVAADPAGKFEPLDGQALRVMIPAGKNLGLDMRYKFSDKVGYEPEEIYMRYYLRLANDWNPTTDGGKLPGISATYGQVGWGGRKADGKSGWSMRGSFYRIMEQGNPYHAYTPIGTYAYHADMEDYWGDAWAWSSSGAALLERNRWYCVEQYVRLNRPGRKDGLFRAWVDGQPVFERTDVRYRDTNSIKIEEVWMNVYYGGTNPSPQDQHLFIDNVVIARKYIGPMQR